MEKKSYHHKDLRKELIKEGLKLLHEAGYDQFSLRKVASRCNASHNAPYRHFSDKEDLIQAILSQAVGEFQECLLSAVEEKIKNPAQQLKDMGFNYINFFIKNPEYHTLFFSSRLKGTVEIKGGEFNFGKAHLFGLLEDCVKRFLHSKKMENKYTPMLVLEFWSTVHGLTSLISTGKVIFDDDYEGYINRIIDRIVSNVEQT